MALSEKKKASNAAWDNKNLKRMSLALRIDLFDKMKAYIESTGESANGFISNAISEKLDRELQRQDISIDEKKSNQLFPFSGSTDNADKP